MTRPWFDPSDGRLLLDDYVPEMASWQSVIADSEITDEEIAQQAQRVTELLRRLEQRLPTDLKELAAEAFCELAVLSLLQHKRAERGD